MILRWHLLYPNVCFVPKEKIVKSGLWLVNELYKTTFDADGVKQISRMIGDKDGI